MNFSNSLGACFFLQLFEDSLLAELGESARTAQPTPCRFGPQLDVEDDAEPLPRRPGRPPKQRAR